MFFLFPQRSAPLVEWILRCCFSLALDVVGLSFGTCLLCVQLDFIYIYCFSMCLFTCHQLWAFGLLCSMSHFSTAVKNATAGCMPGWSLGPKWSRSTCWPAILVLTRSIHHPVCRILSSETPDSPILFGKKDLQGSSTKHQKSEASGPISWLGYILNHLSLGMGPSNLQKVLALRYCYHHRWAPYLVGSPNWMGN